MAVGVKYALRMILEELPKVNETKDKKAVREFGTKVLAKMKEKNIVLPTHFKEFFRALTAAD